MRVGMVPARVLARSPANVSPVQMTKPRFATRDMVWQERQFRRGLCSFKPCQF